MLGWFCASDATLGWEVMAKRVEDHGGGLARIDGRIRLVEGLALPREEDEFALTYYNTNSCWVDIDRLLALFGLCRRPGGHRQDGGGGAPAGRAHAHVRY